MSTLYINKIGFYSKIVGIVVSWPKWQTFSIVLLLQFC